MGSFAWSPFKKLLTLCNSYLTIGNAHITQSVCRWQTSRNVYWLSDSSAQKCSHSLLKLWLFLVLSQLLCLHLLFCLSILVHTFYLCCAYPWYSWFQKNFLRIEYLWLVLWGIYYLTSPFDGLYKTITNFSYLVLGIIYFWENLLK